MSRQVGRTVEEALDALKLHLDPLDVAAALGIQPESVAAALRRAGKQKEAQAFLEANAKAKERARDALRESQWGVPRGVAA